jgi:uncharacterized membrane protein YqjE
MTQTGSRPQMEQLSDLPTGELVKRMSEQMSQLVREELRLAQAEMTQKGKRMGLGAGMFGGAALVAMYGVGALTAMAIAALSLAMAVWAAALIVGVALLLVAGALALMGKKQVGQATPMVPERAVDSVKTDVHDVKERARR